MEEQRREEENLALESIAIPLNIFSTELGTLETLAKYLKETMGYSFSDIAALLNRDPRTIWGAYSSALEKHPEPFFGIPETSIELPVAMLQDRHFGMLENLVWHMHENLGMKYSRIAVLIKRNDRTVWTAWMRARKKRLAYGLQ
jgi:hypothetical protein